MLGSFSPRASALIALLLLFVSIGAFPSHRAVGQTPAKSVLPLQEELPDHLNALRERLESVRSGAKKRRSASVPAKAASGVTQFSYVQEFTFESGLTDELNFDVLGPALRAGDVNGDGIDDYVYVTTDARDERTSALEDVTAKTALYYGSSTPSKLHDALYYEALIPAGDLDGDGHADALTNADDGTLRFYRGTSSGYSDTGITLSRASNIGSDTPNGGGYRAFTDLDGDGYDDVLFFNRPSEDDGDGSSTIDILFGAGDLSNASIKRTEINPQSKFDTDFYSYLTADIDSSGSGEIVEFAGDSFDKTEISVFSVDGSRSVTEEQVFQDHNLSRDANPWSDLSNPTIHSWLVDVTGDSTLDLVLKDGLFDDTTYVYEQTSPLAFDASTGPTLFTIGEPVPIGDLNGDGRHDFYTFDDTDSTHYVSFGPSTLSSGLNYDEAVSFPQGVTGDRSIVTPSQVGSRSPEYLPTGAMGDLTGDSRTDGMLSYLGSFRRDAPVGRRFVGIDDMQGVETVDITFKRQAFTNEALQSQNVGDINGDGYDDLAFVSRGLGEIQIYHGGSTVDTGVDQVLTGEGATRPQDVVTGDFNGDGKEDVAVAYRGTDSASSEIAFYVGADIGSSPDHTIEFEDTAPPTADDGFYRITNAGDLDNDGADDVLASAPFSYQESAGGSLDHVWVFYGASPLPTAPDETIDYGAQFSNSNSDLAGYRLSGPGDMNGDSVDDVVVAMPTIDNANGTTGRIFVYYGQDGMGPDFSSPDRTIRPNGSEYGFGYGLDGGGDLNGDGAPDLVVAPLAFPSSNSANASIYLYYGGSSGFDTTPDQKFSPPAASLMDPTGRLSSDTDGDGKIDINVSALAFIPDTDGDGDDELLYPSGFGAATNALVYLGGQPPGPSPNGVFEAPNEDASLGGGFGVAVGDFNDNGTMEYVLSQSRDNNDAAVSSRVYRYETNTLPVELGSLTAARDGASAAVLRWTTVSEMNNAGFAIQHKAPGNDAFARLGYRVGQGTTSQPHKYRFRAEGLDPGRHTFRLKQEDVDGSASVTDSVTVVLAMREAYRLSSPQPNPASDRAQLSVRVREKQSVEVTLYDALGRAVRTIHDGPIPGRTDRRLTVDGATLPSGTYFVRVAGDTFEATRRLTIVQ